MVYVNKYQDLEDRTLEFGLSVIRLCDSPKAISSLKVIYSQLSRSATSVGANYREANESSSKKEFFYRIQVCRKELRETKYWLTLLLRQSQPVSSYISECVELMKIFTTISKTNIEAKRV